MESLVGRKGLWDAGWLHLARVTILTDPDPFGYVRVEESPRRDYHPEREIPLDRITVLAPDEDWPPREDS